MIIIMLLSLEDVILSLKHDEYCIQNHSQPIEPEIQLQTVLPLQSHHLLTKPFKPDFYCISKTSTLLFIETLYVGM